jgi:hypothetical protein
MTENVNVNKATIEDIRVARDEESDRCSKLMKLERGLRGDVEDFTTQIAACDLLTEVILPQAKTYEDIRQVASQYLREARLLRDNTISQLTHTKEGIETCQSRIELFTKKLENLL